MPEARRLSTTWSILSIGACLVLVLHILILIDLSIPCYRQSSVVIAFYKALCHVNTLCIVKFCARRACTKYCSLPLWSITEICRTHCSLILTIYGLFRNLESSGHQADLSQTCRHHTNNPTQLNSTQLDKKSPVCCQSWNSEHVQKFTTDKKLTIFVQLSWVELSRVGWCDPEMCPRGQVFSLEDPRGQMPWPWPWPIGNQVLPLFLLFKLLSTLRWMMA